MSAEEKNLRRRLGIARDEMEAQSGRLVEMRIEMEAGKRAYERLRDWAESLAQSLHDLDGEERNCRGHEYVTGPSCRGVGFDDECRHCVHFRTLRPVY